MTLIEASRYGHTIASAANGLIASGVTFISLLALSDEGAPSFNAALAGRLAALGALAFACTPDRFPDLMAAAMGRRSIAPAEGGPV